MQSKIQKTWLFLALVSGLWCPAADGQTDTLRLLFTGDIMGHIPQINSAEVVHNKKYNYTPCFQYVKPLLEQADLAIGNLELTLPGKPPYTGYPMFRSPDDLATALKEAGYDILVTANNHADDSHGAGVVHTIEVLRDLGLQQTGTFKNPHERSSFYPLMVYKKGFKLAILNCTYGTNGMPTDAPTIVNMIDTLQIKADLEEARARKPHFIIAFMHWGIEYQLQENEEQRSIARFLIRNGADLVIGSHPHVVQPIRIEGVAMPGNVRREAIVVYSLGNFISSQTQPNTDGGIMFQLDLLKPKGSAAVRIGQYGMIPVWRYIHHPANGKSVYYTVPIFRTERDPGLVKGMTASAQAAMTRYAESLRKRMNARELRF